MPSRARRMLLMRNEQTVVLRECDERWMSIAYAESGAGKREGDRDRETVVVCVGTHDAAV